MERVARHAWLGILGSSCTLKACKDSSHPFRVRRLAKLNQGLRSFHSLNPWLPSLHPFGVLISPRDDRLYCGTVSRRRTSWPQFRTIRIVDGKILLFRSSAGSGTA